MSLLAGPAWRVHLATADITCLRLRLAPYADRDPWPLTRVMTELTALGARAVGRPHALGSGRGMPLLHRQAWRWGECELHVEAHHAGGVDEIAVELPPWDELVELVAAEDILWRLIDTIAAASDARWGVIGDGEALEPGPPSLRRHACILVADDRCGARGVAATYTTLPLSGLTVLLR